MESLRTVKAMPYNLRIKESAENGQGLQARHRRARCSLDNDAALSARQGLLCGIARRAETAF
jgi:hypothetical protein